MKRLDMYYKTLEMGNEKLSNSTADKERVLEEVKSESLLQVTLKVHLYIERELNVMLNELNLDYTGIHNNRFKTKLDIIYRLSLIDKKLYDVIAKLNLIRNDFAHKIDSKKDSELYKQLLDGASGFVLDNHKNDVKMKELLYKKELSTSHKIKMLLVNIWITLKFTSTNMNKVKLNMAKRLEDEVQQKINELE
ncbi:hypothetical protein ACQKMI_10050 [Lysinibacillus sp. NPDC097214]|uniref:hypothetical protein n=1 Tax=Lysinibacillus sp. NPDC097214 TaxID=3390584 RepID=UPI003D047E4D